MTTNKEITNPYAILSPQARHIALTDFYARLRPSQSVSLKTNASNLQHSTMSDQEKLSRLAEQCITQIFRIERSEYTHQFLNKLDLLLETAPITQPFRRHIRFYFEIYNLSGVDQTHPSGRRLSLVLNLSDPRSGGIFDQDTAKTIEQESFLEVRRIKDYISLEDNLNDWRLAYWRKYGIDPRKK